MRNPLVSNAFCADSRFGLPERNDGTSSTPDAQRRGAKFSRAAILFLTAVAVIIGCSSARFNTYYNASKLYQEAEDLSKSRNKGSKPSGTEDTKLNNCLDKCRIIITRYSESGLVDDALFLMGKAFVLKQSHSAAADKFSELREYFPESPFVDASYYLEAKERSELEQWARVENLLKIHLQKGDRWTVWQERSALLLAQIAEWNYAYERALGHVSDLLGRAGRKEVIGQAYLLKGRCLREVGRLDDAVDAFAVAFDRASTREDRFEGQIEKGETLALLGRGEEALTTFRELSSIARVDSELAQVGLSVGKSWLSLNEFREAEEAWRNVIQAYPREGAAKRAMMELATMLETKEHELGAALKEYEELSKQGRPRALVEEAGRRAKALRKVLELTEALKDSSAELGARLMELADTYLFSLELPDSASRYYHLAHEEFPESSWAARALYVEAWILGQGDDSLALISSELTERLVSDYGWSAQARTVLADRGDIPQIAQGMSESMWLLTQGEAWWLYMDDPRAALETLGQVSDSFPKSPEASKALLACAWICSESLHDTTAAKSYLEKVTELYPKTEEARRAATELGVSLTHKTLPYDIPPSLACIDTVTCEEIAPVDSLHRLGVIDVRVLVDATGEAKNVELVKGTGSLLCDDAAMQAARGAEYAPALKDSSGVEAWLDIGVPFIPTRPAPQDSTES